MWWGPKHGWPGGCHLGECWVNKKIVFSCSCLYMLTSMLTIEIAHTKHLWQLGKLSWPNCAKNLYFNRQLLVFKSNQWKVDVGNVLSYIICKFPGATMFHWFDLGTKRQPFKTQIFFPNLALKDPTIVTCSLIVTGVFYDLFLLSNWEVYNAPVIWMHSEFYVWEVTSELWLTCSATV